MYMLDSNICIYLINNKSASLTQRIANVQFNLLFISSIVIAELEYGVAKSTNKDKNSKALNNFTYGFNIVSFDTEASKEYGIIRASLEMCGNTIGANDMLIAAHAKSRGDILVTSNKREFDRIEGLVVEDWLL